MSVIIRNLYRGIYFFGFSTGYYFLSTYLRERKRAQELEQDKLKAIIQHQQMQQELTNAQNAFLKAQINPHFLFNTLDFVYHNVNKHSPMAGEAVARLAEMMRFAIAAGEREQNIRLGDEIEQVENLIFLYQIRKNNGLAISFIYPEEALELKIIPLVLLTLVENVFKHGYLTSDEKDRAEIILAIDGEVLRIETNNSIGRLQTLMSNKTGLKNVDERLGFAYGKNYAFSHEAKGNKFSVRLSIAISLLQYKPAVAKHAKDIDII
ncbi:sensor histidine kinase [Pedobacter namyangjuensis]|uniref:sensor histidine kinase n=1 Tax=Pedobacter namyangjuensis TaxID=600626 RepID=UPI0013B3817E|nr:histidine kinase [Pedobacter namyangjuensis]